jgi:hypothetical protein
MNERKSVCEQQPYTSLQRFIRSLHRSTASRTSLATADLTV